MSTNQASSTTRILAIIPVFGETQRIKRVIEKFQLGSVTEICVVLDSPTENAIRTIKEAASKLRIPVNIVTNSVRKGIGFAIRQGYEYAFANQFQIIVVMAGNEKDDPREIPRLTDPIINHGYDYVQGSRYLPGGRRVRNPFLRRIFTRLFPLLWTWITGTRCTDVTNGFRAYRTVILQDSRMNIWQDWLDRYELEYYLHYKVLTLGYKFTERPVSKIYPLERRGYTKISPFRDWWQIVGPIVLLKTGART